MKTNSQQLVRPNVSHRPSAALVRAVLVLAIVLVASFASAQLRVVVSIEPYREAVERLVGDGGTVDVLLPAGASPHAFDPTPRDVVRLSDADLIVVNGVADDWTLDLVEALGADAPPVFVALDAVADDELLEGGHDHDHAHDEPTHDDHADEEHHDEEHHEDEHHDEEHHDDEHHDDEHAADDHDGHDGHDHGDVNAHVWLDPLRMSVIVDALAVRIAELDPARADDVRAAAAAYRAELDALDAEIAARLAPFAGAPFVPFHDAWPYFAERYGLDLVLEVEPFPGREPSARALAEAVTTLREVGARAIFTETQLDDRPARVLADEAGVALGVLDPLGGVEGREGYLALQRYNAAAIEEALSGEAGER
jgi:ABC-type Zn uptake system ZnuABC Zn-binding protein ZnuA